MTAFQTSQDNLTSPASTPFFSYFPQDFPPCSYCLIHGPLTVQTALPRSIHSCRCYLHTTLISQWCTSPLHMTSPLSSVLIRMTLFTPLESSSLTQTPSGVTAEFSQLSEESLLAAVTQLPRCSQFSLSCLHLNKEMS